jgi:alpha-beta hydrolase superfamily lysophospholipase
MIKSNYFEEKLISHDGVSLTLHHWPVKNPKFLIQLIHGMSEHGYRYNEFSKWLNSKNVYAYSLDLRGHGKTAKNIDSIGLFNETNGWEKVVLDIKLCAENISALKPKIPTIIMGHSMGSFLARTLAIKFPNVGNHYIYSATSCHPGLKGHIGGLIAKFNSFIFGKQTRSKFLQFLVMGEFNKKIKNPRTKKDWLSNDEKVVDDYIKDPFCMQVFKNQFFVDLAYGVMWVNDINNLKKTNKNKAILMLSGDMDPVGNYGKGVKKLYYQYKQADIQNTELKLFKNGRHEMLNEINKEEVYNYIYNWIDKTLLND